MCCAHLYEMGISLKKQLPLKSQRATQIWPNDCSYCLSYFTVISLMCSSGNDRNGGWQVVFWVDATVRHMSYQTHSAAHRCSDIEEMDSEVHAASVFLHAVLHSTLYIQRDAGSTLCHNGFWICCVYKTAGQKNPDVQSNLFQTMSQSRQRNSALLLNLNCCSSDRVKLQFSLQRNQKPCGSQEKCTA